MKCPICKNKGVVYHPNIRIYGARKQHFDLGYWDVCTCNKEKKGVKLENLNKSVDTKLEKFNR